MIFYISCRFYIYWSPREWNNYLFINLLTWCRRASIYLHILRIHVLDCLSSAGGRRALYVNTYITTPIPVFRTSVRAACRVMMIIIIKYLLLLVSRCNRSYWIARKAYKNHRNRFFFKIFYYHYCDRRLCYCLLAVLSRPASKFKRFPRSRHDSCFLFFSVHYTTWTFDYVYGIPTCRRASVCVYDMCYGQRIGFKPSEKLHDLYSIGRTVRTIE